MRVGGVGPPRSFCLDMVGQIGYECRYCGTRGWGPGSSPGLICSYEPGDITVELDGNAWFAKRTGFVDLQESVAGFGDTHLAAVKDLLNNERNERAALAPSQADQPSQEMR